MKNDITLSSEVTEDIYYFLLKSLSNYLVSGPCSIKILLDNGVELCTIDGTLCEVNCEIRPEFEFNFNYKDSGLKTLGEYQLNILTQYVSIEKHEDINQDNKQQKEITNMLLKNHKIASVKLAEINPITLELAIKKLTASNNKLQLIERKDVAYLVIDGADPIELEGELFKNMISEALVGKTIAEVEADKNISELLANLNIIEEIVFKKPKTSLKTLFS